MRPSATIVTSEPSRTKLASPNGIVYADPPSTVPTILAMADAVGHELPASYRTMTPDVRTGDLLPEHLVGQTATPEH